MYLSQKYQMQSFEWILKTECLLDESSKKVKFENTEIIRKNHLENIYRVLLNLYKVSVRTKQP